MDPLCKQSPNQESSNFQSLEAPSWKCGISDLPQSTLFLVYGRVEEVEELRESLLGNWTTSALALVLMIRYVTSRGVMTLDGAKMVISSIVIEYTDYLAAEYLGHRAKVAIERDSTLAELSNCQLIVEVVGLPEGRRQSGGPRVTIVECDRVFDRAHASPARLAAYASSCFRAPWSLRHRVS